MKKIFREWMSGSMMLIFLCFLLTSTGWLAWEYHLLELLPAAQSDVATMVAGYLLQAVGIGLFLLILHFREQGSARVLPAALALHYLCMLPAVLSPLAAGALVSGLLMNVFCGMIAGVYLHQLTRGVPKEKRASVFGLGYGLAVFGSWLLSVIAGGVLYYSRNVLFVCALLTAAVMALYHGMCQKASWQTAGKTTGDGAQGSKAAGAPHKSMLLLSFVLVLLFSMINSSGFAFPSADILKSVNVEQTRLIYAAGLVIAGAVADMDRRYCGMCALGALVVPFIVLALRAQATAAVIFWLLGYFVFGFYAVFRVILFSDIALQRSALYLSGMGLMAGRAGDALGEGICISLSDRPVMLIIVTAALFAVAIPVFFFVYHKLCIPQTVPQSAPQPSQEALFYRFASAYSLSSREREVLKLLLDEKTNGEISDALSVSERTVKFHVHNILQKTGQKSRNELIALYATGQG